MIPIAGAYLQWEVQKMKKRKSDEGPIADIFVDDSGFRNRNYMGCL